MFNGSWAIAIQLYDIDFAKQHFMRESKLLFQVSYISVILQLIQCFISAMAKKLRINLIMNED